MYYNTGIDLMIMKTIYGYWRCSTDAQDQERQIRSLKDAGCEVIVGDKITGTSNYGDRKELAKLLDEIEEGSLLILDELSRLGRTMVTMLVEVNKLLEKGVKIRTLDGRLDTTTMPSEIINLIVSVMGYSAEMELTNIRRRTAEDKHQISEIMRKREQGEGYGTIGRALGMSRATVASIVKREVAV